MNANGHEPTEEQSSILSLACSSNDNILINAYAGTGKTYMLEMIERNIDTRPILYLAFNKRNVEEAQDKFQSTTTVRTMNGLGDRILKKAISGKVAVNGKKTIEQLRAMIDEMPKSAQGAVWSVFWEVVHGVGLAKNLGYIPEGKFTHVKPLTSREAFHARLEEEPDDLVADLIDACLSLSIQTAYKGNIDFNDQIYMPAIFNLGIFPQFPLVMVDERQDLNPVNDLMIKKLARKRLIAVGDRYQSIYAFRGAMPDGMDRAQQDFNMTPATLSVSFRCPEAVVLAAQWRVPDYKWIKEGGHVEHLEHLSADEIPEDATFICRNNAPLFKLAMQFLVVGRSVRVQGSDVGPKLIGIIKKLGEGSMSRASLLDRIEDWRAEKLAKESKTANDIADCMKVFATFGENLDQAVAYAEHLFTQKGKLTLLTGHKAKGLEWDTVYHLDPWLIHDYEDEQEKNLRYVITTRSANRLFEIDSNRISWR